MLFKRALPSLLLALFPRFCLKLLHEQLNKLLVVQDMEKGIVATNDFAVFAMPFTQSVVSTTPAELLYNLNGLSLNVTRMRKSPEFKNTKLLSRSGAREIIPEAVANLKSMENLDAIWLKYKEQK